MLSSEPWPGVFLNLVAACIYIHYAHVTACDSIEHVKKCLFGNFGSDVQGGSVGRVSVFRAKDMGHFFSFFSSF